MTHTLPDFETMRDTGLAMSNFDHEVDDGMAEALKADPNAYAHHYGWEFCATVVYADGLFRSYVRRYRVHVGTLEAATLEELMEATNAEYGSA